MQERVNRYIPPSEFTVSQQVVPNYRVRGLVERTDATIANIDHVLSSDTTSAYIDRKKTLLTDQRTELAGSEAFRLEYDRNISEGALYEDIVSYLGEYRFQVPEYTYKQRFSTSVGDPEIRLRGEKEDKPLITMGYDAIKDKRERGEDVGKVESDLLGMQKIEAFLVDAKDGDRIVYASPPDLDYGFDYGFFYDGRVETLDTDEKVLHLRAMRLDKSSDIEDYNKALSLLTGDEKKYATANQFIENPEHIIKPISDSEVSSIIQEVFKFESSTSHAAKFKQDITEMQPYITGVMDLIRNGAPLSQIQQSFHALENLALSLKEKPSIEQEGTVIFSNKQKEPKMGFGDFVSAFGYKPPEVQGSCGSSGGRNSNNIFGMGSIFNSGVNGAEKQEWFSCPECPYKATGPIGNGGCPGCGLTKEIFAEKSGIRCD